MTAGIIPYNIQSQHGNMVLYDMAGQPEYYTSHCACIEAISFSSPAIFLTLVDVSLKQEEIIKQIHYWSTMISSVCSECPHPSEVIVLGTHVDKVNKKDLLCHTNVIEDLAKTIFNNQHFRGFIALDATARFSDNMKRFIGVLSESNDTVVQQSPVISTDCHILYAFLQLRVPSEQVITISSLLSELQADQTNVLSAETSTILPLLTTLSAKGLILFILNKRNPDKSWIVVQKNMLLERVAERPANFDPTYINTKGSFGWLMRTKIEHQFFHNRFLHVLMLTLINTCDGTEALCNPQLKSLNRQCIVWSTGMCWNSEHGVTILFDVVEQFRSLYVAVSFPGPQYQELTVLHDIRKTFNQFCSSIDVEELVIDPRQVYTLFNKGVMPSSLPRVEISKLKNAILSKSDAVCDFKGNVVAIAEWIRAESRLPKLIGIEHAVPSSSSSLPSDLVDQTNSHLKVPSSQLLSELISQTGVEMEETPTLLQVLSLTDKGVNIIEQIGINYLHFGIFLLEDSNGAIVEALENEHLKNAERINLAILRKWLDGKGVKPVTWSTLVTVLQKIRMRK
ncbi:hypothetical protein EMCRGX_G019281 [Ephydatia muelleri]